MFSRKKPGRLRRIAGVAALAIAAHAVSPHPGRVFAEQSGTAEIAKGVEWRHLPPGAVFRKLICAGTPHETTVFYKKGETEGKTALVIGGMHGDEPAGAEAVKKLLGKRLESGNLILVPESNPSGLKGKTHGDLNDVNLNTQFREGTKHPLAQELMKLIDASDVVINLHEAFAARARQGNQVIIDRDSLKTNPDTLDLKAIAEKAVSEANKTVAGSDFKVVNDRTGLPGGRRDCLKATTYYALSGKHGRPAFAIETLRGEWPLGRRTDNQVKVIKALLNQFGIEVKDARR